MHDAGPGNCFLNEFLFSIPGKIFYQVAVELYRAVGVPLISHIKDFDAAEIHLLSLPGFSAQVTLTKFIPGYQQPSPVLQASSAGRLVILKPNHRKISNLCRNLKPLPAEKDANKEEGDLMTAIPLTRNPELGTKKLGRENPGRAPCFESASFGRTGRGFKD
jgi:hypothetical protein